MAYPVHKFTIGLDLLRKVFFNSSFVKIVTQTPTVFRIPQY